MATKNNKINWEARSDSRGQGFVKKQHVAYLADYAKLIVRAHPTSNTWDAYRVDGFVSTKIGEFATVGAAKAAAVATLAS